MKKKVLLTGATGFVGRKIYKNLLKQEIDIKIVVRRTSVYKIPDLDPATEILFTDDLFSETFEWWSLALNNIDMVIHAAWYAEPGLYLESEKNNDCLIGTLVMAKAAVKARVKRFVGIGSCFEYDLNYGILSTKTPLNPITLYARAKVAAFQVLSAYFLLHRISFAWCRLFYLFGEGEDPRRLVPYLHLQLSQGKIAELSAGDQIRDYLDVEEAGKMIVTEAFGEKSGPANICSCVPQKVKDIAEKIAYKYERIDLLRFGVRKENITDPPVILGCRE
jgi:nucleoside-diphosphate-sugar epimerase